MTLILNGKEVSEIRKEQLKIEVKMCARPPHLCVIIVGNQIASTTYVKNKERACKEVGISSSTLHFEESISEEQLLLEIEKCNEDATVDGILLQLPLPNHIDTQNAIMCIHPDKDVDGFHPLNMGKLLIGLDGFESCTPKGIITLLKNYQIELSGKHVVIVGRSNIVGKPLVPLFLRENASVSIVHSKTNNIKEVTKTADILVVAAGKEKLVDETWIKEGVIIIDVGIHRNSEGKLCGDVNFERVKHHCCAISPVPRGVGPMTIVSLLENTVSAYQRRVEKWNTN